MGRLSLWKFFTNRDLELVFSKSFHRKDHQNLLIAQLVKILWNKNGSVRAKQRPFGDMLVIAHLGIEFLPSHNLEDWITCKNKSVLWYSLVLWTFFKYLQLIYTESEMNPCLESLMKTAATNLFVLTEDNAIIFS